MKKALLSLVTLFLWVPASTARQEPRRSLTGLWDLTITTSTETYPSWLEIQENGGQPRVHIVGQVASVHMAEQAFMEGGRLTFMSHEFFGKPLAIIWEVQEQAGHLVGTQRREDGTLGKLVGDPEPALDRPTPAKWSPPEPLFDGVDLAGWEPFVEERGKSPINHFSVKQGELINQEPGANLRTLRRFSDFRLHLEYNCPRSGNSGVYLRGRYEVQIEYEANEKNDALHSMGSIYGLLAPSQTLPPTPGRWESFDITLVGRILTLYRNGKLIHDRELITSITGGALDSHEASPGPIYLQGDHTGGMRFRNITISEPQP